MCAAVSIVDCSDLVGQDSPSQLGPVEWLPATETPNIPMLVTGTRKLLHLPLLH